MQQHGTGGTTAPRIIVSHGRLATGAPAASLVADPYLLALAAAGAQAVLAPATLGAGEAGELLAQAHGLLLCGGADVDPSCYGAPRQPYCGPSERLRDEREARLIRASLDLGAPLLAICRGVQMLNAACGGTLWQDIATERPGSLGHRYVEGTEKAAPVHTAAVQSGSRLAGVLGCLEASVNSRHHQAVRDVAPGLVAVAWAPDGVVEAVELPSRAWVIGVQWHPEDMVCGQEHAANLFAGFVAAARRYQEAG
jgi:putative glutamine amidotransferase